MGALTGISAAATTPVVGLSDAVAIAAGADNSCAVRVDAGLLSANHASLQQCEARAFHI